MLIGAFSSRQSVLPLEESMQQRRAAARALLAKSAALIFALNETAGRTELSMERVDLRRQLEKVQRQFAHAGGPGRAELQRQIVRLSDQLKAASEAIERSQRAVSRCDPGDRRFVEAFAALFESCKNIPRDSALLTTWAHRWLLEGIVADGPTKFTARFNRIVKEASALDLTRPEAGIALAGKLNEFRQSYGRQLGDLETLIARLEGIPRFSLSSGVRRAKADSAKLLKLLRAFKGALQESVLHSLDDFAAGGPQSSKSASRIS
jgi:hypothetical protein